MYHRFPVHTGVFRSILKRFASTLRYQNNRKMLKTTCPLDDGTGLSYMLCYLAVIDKLSQSAAQKLPFLCS